MSKRKNKSQNKVVEALPFFNFNEGVFNEGVDFFGRGINFSQGIKSPLLARKQHTVSFDLNQTIPSDATDIRVQLQFNGTRHQVRLTLQR